MNEAAPLRRALLKRLPHSYPEPEQPRQPRKMKRTARAFDEYGFAKPREAAEFLAVSKVWIYDLCRAGILAHIRHGKRYSISWQSVYEYAAARTVRGKSA